MAFADDYASRMIALLTFTVIATLQLHVHLKYNFTVITCNYRPCFQITCNP